MHAIYFGIRKKLNRRKQKNSLREKRILACQKKKLRKTGNE